MFTPGGACAPFQPGVSAVSASIGSVVSGSGSGPGPGLLPLQLPALYCWGDPEPEPELKSEPAPAPAPAPKLMPEPNMEDVHAYADASAYIPDHVVSNEWRAPSASASASASAPAPPSMMEKTVVVILRRTAVVEARQWYEFFVTLQTTSRGDVVFNFPRASTHFFVNADASDGTADETANIARVHAAAQPVYAYAVQRRSRRDAACDAAAYAQTCALLSQACVLVADESEHNVRVALYDVGTLHLAPWHVRRQPLTTAPPRHCWAVESELAWHEHVGRPSVYGVRFSGFARACMETLPPSQRFRTTAPPLVLYHGTSVDALPAIKATGVLPSDADAMLGAGVYFARWDKAARFAHRHAHGGVVLRCVVFAGRVAVIDPDFLCTCGCAQRGVDHVATHAARYDTAYVPGTSTSVRDAEWCVYHAHSRVWVDAAVDRITAK